MSAIATRIPTAAAPAATPTIFGAPTRWIDTLSASWRSKVDAEQMRAIDDRLLADAGIDPAAIGKSSEGEEHARLMMNLMSCR